MTLEFVENQTNRSLPGQKVTNLNERRESEHKGKQKENRGRKSQQEIKDGVELPDGGVFQII